MNKKRAFVVGIILVAVVSAIALIGQPNNRQVTKIQGDRVLVLRLYGGIQEGGGGGLLGIDGSISPQLVRRQLARAARDRSVHAVVLRISSPGGSVAASQEIYNMIRRFEKPIVVSMGDQAASGGYYISAAADGIVANPGTTTGSIGVISTTMNLEGLYEMLGVEVEIIKSGRHKDMFQRPLTDEERQLLQAVSDEAWYQFIHDVAEGRNLEPEYVQELATGEIFMGSQALELGLVDRLGGLDEAIALAGELAGLENPVAYELPAPTLWQQLSGLSAEVVGILRSRLTPLPLELIEAFEGVPRIRY